MTIEVGVRGFIATSVKKCFAALGLPKQKNCQGLQEIVFISACCSHNIFLAATSKFWDENKPLFEANSE